MATSGRHLIEVTPWNTLRWEWERTAVSVENNTSTIAWKLLLISGSEGHIDSTASTNWSVRVNSVTKSGTNSVRIGNNTTKTLASGTQVIEHNADGSKAVGYSFSQQFGLKYDGEDIGVISGSGTFTLDPIARASQPSLVTWPETTNNVGDFGETFAIHMNRASDSFTHTVRYEYGDRKGTIATGVGTGTTWAVPMSFMNDIPDALSASGRIYVDTYNGSTLVGTKYTGFTVTIPASVKPSCSATLEDTTGIDDIYGSPVKGLSKIKVTVSAQQAYSSPIVSYAVTIDGVRYSSDTITTGLLKNAGNSPVQVTVTDKRGRTSSVWSYPMTVLDYTAPSISRLTVKRTDADGNDDDQGSYVQVTFSAAVNGMSGKNTAAYTLWYKKSTANSWALIDLAALENTYTVKDRTALFAADLSSSYDVELTVTDRHNTALRSTSASTAFSLMDWHPSGTGLRFGGVSELENTFQNDLDLRQVGNTYVFQPSDFNGEKGYTLLAVITITGYDVNAPIVFTINRRAAFCPMTVHIRFASASATTDPDLQVFTYEGDDLGAFLVKTAASTWKLYIDNTYGWLIPCLQSWYTTDSQRRRIDVEFPNEQVDTLPTPYRRAVPVVPRSILDAFMPVGFVLTLYSNADPNAMYFRTTWVRIQNAFLLAVDENGDVGSTDNIPLMEPANNDNTLPYVRVSIWRRTA